MKKILAFLIAILIVMSSFSSCQHKSETAEPGNITTPPQSTNEDDDAKITTPIQPEEEMPKIPSLDELPEGSPFSSYESIIEMYKKIAEISFEYDDEKTYYDMFELSTEAERKLLDILIMSSYLALPKSGQAQYNCSLGYALKDIDNNGSDELILLYDYGAKVTAIFSLYSGKPILLDYYWDRHECNISKKGELYVRGSSGAANTSYSKYVIVADGSGLELISEYGTGGLDDSGNVIYYNLVDGEKVSITDSEFERLDEQRRMNVMQWVFEYVLVAQKSKDISSEALSKKLGCQVLQKCYSNLGELMDEQSKGIFATPTTEGEEYKLKIYVQNENEEDYTITTVNLPKPYKYGDLVSSYCGFTSETDGYVLVFYRGEHSLSGGDAAEFLYMLKTSDSGQTWEFTEYSNPIKVDDRNWVKFVYFFDEKIGMFSTEYTPIYRITTDGGKTWESIPPLPVPPIDDVLGVEHYREIVSIERIDGKYLMTVGIRYGESQTVNGICGFCIQYVSDDLQTWKLV